MSESWSYQLLKGDFADRCGHENWYTTCERNREKEEEYEIEETDYNNCEDWEEDAVQSYSSGDSGSSNPYSGGSGLGSDSGSNSNESNYNDHVDSSSDRYPDSVEEKVVTRNPARSCRRWGTKNVKKKRWIPAGTVRYSCTKQRPLWCTWFETATMERGCKQHVAKFNVKYKKSPEWKPGYVHPNDRARDYHDLLPNKFDLLPGESEKIAIYANTGTSSVMNPSIAFDSRWNKYSFEVSPRQLNCTYGMKPQINFQIITVGRNKTKSPNVLSLPLDMNGQPMDPLDNENRPLTKLPSKLQMQDASRAMMLQASLQSRTFPRPEAARERDQKALFKNLPVTERLGTAENMGFWLDTQFKIQMFRYDKWDRMVRMTPETKFSETNVDTFNDYITVSFDDGRLPQYLYRGVGPLQSVFGWAWRAFGVELSPGKKYVMLMQTSQRGLPFYESGCSGDRDVCEGEAVKNSAFGEPIRFEFEADENIKRSFIRRFKDWVAARALF